MINYVFTTKRYEEEARRYSALNEVQKIREKMNKTPDYEPDRYDSFPGNYLKVKFSNNFRIIFTRRELKVNDEEIRIYIALRVLKRGDKEYERFKFVNTSETDRDTITGKSVIDWDFYVKQVGIEMSKPTEDSQKPDMTIAEYNFISTPLNINHELFDVTIYETKNWIKNVQEEDFTDFSNAASTIEEYIFNHLKDEDGWYIIEFKTKAISIYHDDTKWILDRILNKNDNGDYDELISLKKPIDYQRGYPFNFLADKDVWRIMEQDKKSNMVLSQQQVEIVSKDIQFPLFLTGRAGSGKSTILQYLFAEIILRYLNISKQYRYGLKLPLYLSYSSNLIADARNLCKTLFEKNNVYQKQLLEGDIRYKDDIDPLMEKMFFVFNDLLRICIDSKQIGESGKRFPKDENYISFPIFNEKWNKKFGKVRDAAKKYGPSISWHVIRTYIKGWDSDKMMTPDEYALIGEKNQTVSVETFKIIFEEVWSKWYSRLENVWDDQDIVRYCLENNLVDDRYSAIFCDESQDFTRIEIDLILKLSSFSNRSLNNASDIKKLPFVFAGDEFQTLNPTGFSWATLSSYFTESLCKSTGLVDSLNELRVPDPIELSENFRSTRQVVMLANRIQLLRAARFGEYSKPQTPHFSEDGNSIYCVSPSNKFILDKLKEKKVILIVPAADGESVEDYIENSSLKGTVEFEKGVPQDITILNPTQAKGLEYPNVAIYGFNCFGQYSQLQLDSLLNWFTAPKDDAISDIELRYQVSNAYVAVTRAGSNLYILDDFDDNSFWAFSFNHDDPNVDAKVRELQDKMYSTLSVSQQSHWSDEELGWIENMPETVDITDENLSYLKSEEHKNDLENRAEALHDPKLMRQAACIHKSAGNKKDEARCKAKAFNFEEDYLQAAEWFEIAEDYEAAIENYWMQLNNDSNKDIINRIAHLNDRSQNIKVRICVMCAKPSIRNLKLAVADVLEVLSKDQHEHATICAWQFVLNYILHNIQAKKNEGLHDISVIVEQSQKLAENDLKLNIDKLAYLSYKIGAFGEAINLWENMDSNHRPKEYFFAKRETLKYPETVEYYEGTGDANWMTDLLQIYRRNSNVALNDNQRRIIAHVVKTAGKKEEFLTFLPFMLRSAYSIEMSQKVLNDSDKYGCNLNKIVLNALFETRFTHLSNWKRPTQSFSNQEISILFDAIETIKRMREDNFSDYLNRSLKVMKVIDFGKKYNTFSRRILSK